MEAKDYLAYIVNEIHTTIVATVDDEGLPITAAIDMMDSDDNSLFFLTAKGKGFYDRLKKRGFLALTAIKGQDTMSSVAVSIRGKVREVGYDRIPLLFEKNPYMHQIYPTDEAMHALTVFVLACFVGYYVVWKVTPALHAPLMSVTNAISSVIIVGAIFAATQHLYCGSRVFGFIAIVLVSINIFGGFTITHRMLNMFRKK